MTEFVIGYLLMGPATLLPAGCASVSALPAATIAEWRRLRLDTSTGLAAAWRAHQAELLAEATRRGLKPRWNGRFFGQAFAEFRP